MGEATSQELARWVPSGAMAAMTDPRVGAWRRLLARQAFPVLDAGALRGESEDVARLLLLLRPEDFPLCGLRHALFTLELRLRDRTRQLPVVDMDAAWPGDLVGPDPATRAARSVFRCLRRSARRLGFDRMLSRREAFDRAIEFRGLCRAWMPRMDARGMEGRVAMHAWAQCYAREYLCSPVPCGPSAACDEAAVIAVRLLRRLARSGDAA